MSLSGAEHILFNTSVWFGFVHVSFFFFRHYLVGVGYGSWNYSSLSIHIGVGTEAHQVGIGDIRCAVYWLVGV